MSNLPFDGNYKAKFIPTIASADLSAVTSAEWDGGTKLTKVTSDGFGFNPTTNNASVNLIDESKTAQKPGTRAYDLQLQFARQDADDDMWNLIEYGLEGYVVIAHAGDPESGDELMVFKGAFHDPTPINSAADTMQQFTAAFPCENWNIKAELAGA